MTLTLYEIDERHIGVDTVVIMCADLRPENDREYEAGNLDYRHSQEPQFSVAVESEGRQLWAQVFYDFSRAKDVYEHPFACPEVPETIVAEALGSSY